MACCQQQATWHNLAEVRATFRHVDSVITRTIFNIKGNDYRLITKIDYAYQKVFIKYVLSHPEYDKGKWKDVCDS
jgi:mRNA interferase HigB